MEYLCSQEEDGASKKLFFQENILDKSLHWQWWWDSLNDFSMIFQWWEKEKEWHYCIFTLNKWRDWQHDATRKTCIENATFPVSSNTGVKYSRGRFVQNIIPVKSIQHCPTRDIIGVTVTDSLKAYNSLSLFSLFFLLFDFTTLGYLWWHSLAAYYVQRSKEVMFMMRSRSLLL